MPNVDISSLFLSKVYTKAQSYRGIRVIKDFVNFIFYELNDKSDLSVAISEFEINSLKRVSNQYISEEIRILKSFDQTFFDEFNQNNLNDKLKELEKGINTTKTFVIYIPFELPELEIEKMGLWIKKNFGAQTIFELSFDPNLIGGCAISFNGVIKDYSLKQKIKENRPKIIEMLVSFKK